MNLWFFKNNQHSGIFNCGTSEANSYNKIADTIIDYFKKIIMISILNMMIIKLYKVSS